MDDRDGLETAGLDERERDVGEEESESEVGEDGDGKEEWSGAWSLPGAPLEVEDCWVLNQPVLEGTLDGHVAVH